MLSAALRGIGGLTILPPLSSQAGAYLADRTIGLALLLLVLLGIGWTRCLVVLLVMTAVIHAVDGAADVYLQEVPAAIGSPVAAGITTLAAVWLFRQPRTTHQVT